MELNFDSTKLVGVNLFPCWADYNCRLRTVDERFRGEPLWAEPHIGRDGRESVYIGHAITATLALGFFVRF